jgi:hypothetical protein
MEWGRYPCSEKLTTVVPFAASGRVQGVRQPGPVGALASAPAGSDSTRTLVVAGAVLKADISMLGIDQLVDPQAESKLPQANTANTRFIVTTRGA